MSASTCPTCHGKCTQPAHLCAPGPLPDCATCKGVGTVPEPGAMEASVFTPGQIAAGRTLHVSKAGAEIVPFTPWQWLTPQQRDTLIREAMNNPPKTATQVLDDEHAVRVAFNRNVERLTLAAALAVGARELQGFEDCAPAGIMLLQGRPVWYGGRGEWEMSWEPYNQDADAFDLAVRLRMHVGLESHAVSVWMPHPHTGFYTGALGDNHDHNRQAVRRAILHCAASVAPPKAPR